MSSIIKILTLLLMLESASAMAGDALFQPRSQTVLLKDFTQLTLDLVPDLGTRFIFPFVLDEAEEGAVPFTLQVTNAIFTTKREAGRNFFVVSVAPENMQHVSTGYLGDLFVSIGGYHISVRLRTSDDIRKHYTDINFILGEGERQSLIDEEVALQRTLMAAEFAQKERDLDQQVEKQAWAMLGRLALTRPDKVRIKEESLLNFGAGDQLTLYVDHLRRYEKFTIIPFTLYSDTEKTVKVMSVHLFGVKAQGEEAFLIDAGISVRPRISAGEEVSGVITTDLSGLQALESLQLVIVTDVGEVSVTW